MQNLIIKPRKTASAILAVQKTIAPIQSFYTDWYWNFCHRETPLPIWLWEDVKPHAQGILNISTQKRQNVISPTLSEVLHAYPPATGDAISHSFSPHNTRCMQWHSQKWGKVLRFFQVPECAVSSGPSLCLQSHLWLQEQSKGDFALTVPNGSEGKGSFYTGHSGTWKTSCFAPYGNATGCLHCPIVDKHLLNRNLSCRVEIHAVLNMVCFCFSQEQCILLSPANDSEDPLLLTDLSHTKCCSVSVLQFKCTQVYCKAHISSAKNIETCL